LSHFQLPGNWYANTRLILNQQDQVEQERKRYVIIKANQRPNVSLSVSVGRDFSDTVNGNSVPTTNVFGGLGVGWNIFDGFSTAANKRASVKQKEIYENELSELEYSLVQEEGILKRDLKINLDGLKLAEKLFSLQLKQHNRQTEDQKKGLISANELRNYRLDFFSKELIVAKKRSELLLMLMDYLSKVEMDPAMNYLDLNVPQ
jgi:outer membrane protein TolC